MVERRFERHKNQDSTHIERHCCRMYWRRNKGKSLVKKTLYLLYHQRLALERTVNLLTFNKKSECYH